MLTPNDTAGMRLASSDHRLLRVLGTEQARIRKSGVTMGEAAGNASRRLFLGMVGAAGASAALLHVMTGRAPVSAAPGWSGRQQLPPGSGSGGCLALRSPVCGSRLQTTTRGVG